MEAVEERPTRQSEPSSLGHEGILAELQGRWVGRDSVRVFLVGFLLAAAFFLVEAGLAEIALARRAECVEQLSRLRLAPAVEQACMPEFEYFLARSLSRGFFAPAESATSGPAAWLLMASAYGLLGGVVARMKSWHGVGIYLGVHLALIMVLMSVDFLSRFIV
jgi:hypothetical protein